jgi:hypothetical protein
MDYGKNVASAAHEKLRTLFSLIVLKFQMMVIILNVKNVVQKSKEDIWLKKFVVHSAAEKKLKKNFS